MFWLVYAPIRNWTLIIIVVDLTESLEKFSCFVMKSSMNYDHPIEGDPTNSILDSRYVFRVLRDTRISPDKSLPYLLQAQTNIFKSCFSCHFLFDYWPWDKDSREMPKKLKIILLSLLEINSRKTTLLGSRIWWIKERKIILYFLYVPVYS